MVVDGGTLAITLVNVITGYLFSKRLMRGTGMGFTMGVGAAFGLLGWYYPRVGIYSGIIFIILIIAFEVWKITNKTGYAHSQLLFEGGGIRRGLSALEAAFILDLDPEVLVNIGITSLLDKGFVTLRLEPSDLYLDVDPDIRIEKSVLSPKERRKIRQDTARLSNQTISDSEDVLLEIIEQNESRGISKISFSFWLEYTHKKSDWKMAGFDEKQTKTYYLNFIHHRLNGIEKGYFSPTAYIVWIVLEHYLHSQEENYFDAVRNRIHPGWLSKDKTLMDWVSVLGGKKSS